ncbi:MAG: hypothetical protein DRP01_03670 [Archaeoglobales archaeon]|nr:MAG: hypothetical protein DRP01_03670 [Archaeoglobales archaeon]
MSNLQSVFDTLRGWPDSSALAHSLRPEPTVALVEGMVVETKSLQLTPAVVLKMMDDSLVTAPTLTAADAGKAYHVAGVGGAWSGFTIGDIVEWSGTAWALILAGSGGTPVGPPDGTRAVVAAAGAAGSFAGSEEKVVVFSTGTPGSWAVADTPVNENNIFINGSGSLYENKFYQYTGAHPAGAWVGAFHQAAPHMSKLSSGVVASVVRDEAWLVIQGNDQFDAQFVDKVTCLKLLTGCTFKVATLIADTLAPGDLVSANAGVLEKTVAGAGMKHYVGVVVESNGVAGAGGIISVAS